MSIVHIDGLEKSDGEVFKAIPAGRVPARIVNVKIKQSGQNAKYPGSDYLNFQAKVKEGHENEGKVLFFMTGLPHDKQSKEAKQMCVDQLKHYALSAEVEVSDDFDFSDFMGQEVCLVVIQERREGKTVNRVTDVLPISVVEEDEEDDD